MPLTLMGSGERAFVQRISGGEDSRRHLQNLGFSAGTEVTLVSKFSGNVIVMVKGSRIALNEDIARRIFV